MSDPSTSEGNDTPWYQTAFSDDYLERYAHRNAAEAELAVEQLVLTLPLESRARVFDLCCGGGRHALAMAEHDLDVIGGDLSMPLLRHAKQEFRRAAKTFSGVRVDMRHHPFIDAHFDLVTHFFTAFGYFESDAENFEVFQEVSRILKVGGYYVFDFLNRTQVMEHILTSDSLEIIEESVDSMWVVEKKISPDGKRAEKKQIHKMNGRIKSSIMESVRIFSKDELTSALLKCGLKPVEIFGTYRRGNFEARTSPRLIFVCRKEP